ncbi:hypothetical protein OSTOST_03660 [Ostertagia ostertagi]
MNTGEMQNVKTEDTQNMNTGERQNVKTDGTQDVNTGETKNVKVGEKGKKQGTPGTSTISDEVIPELQALIPLEGVLVEQKIELLEIISDLESENQYDVKTLAGVPLFHMAEKSNCFCRNINKTRRGFQMVMADFTGKDVIVVESPPGNKVSNMIDGAYLLFRTH